MKNSLTALVKPKFFESKRVIMTSEMLHIGSSVSELANFEFVQANGLIYLPNLDTLARAFKEAKPKSLARPAFARPKPSQKQNNSKQTNELLNEFLEVIKSRNQNSLIKLLEKAFGSEWWEQKDSLGNPVFPETYISEDWANNRVINKLRPMIRDGFGRLYIPGSSIKGAIRTAIAYNFLKKDQDKTSEIELALNEKLGKVDKKKIANNLFMANLFSDFTLVYQEKGVSGETSPQNTDIMRAVKISDSSPMVLSGDYNQSIISEVVVSSYFTQDEINLAKVKNSPSNYVEMVYNAQTEFIFTLDRNNDVGGMLSWFQHKSNLEFPQSIDVILRICKEFAQAQWKHERSYWNSIKNNQNRNFDDIRKFYSDETCPYDLRLGWASGMMGTTVDLLFASEIRKDIRNTCGMAAGDYEAPKSRRTAVAQDGKIRYPLGWVKLEVL